MVSSRLQTHAVRCLLSPLPSPSCEVAMLSQGPHHGPVPADPEEAFVPSGMAW